MLSNSLASSRDLVTPSPPPEESSHDEFTPERHSKSVVSEFISPSTRSNTTANLPSYVRIAINNLYRKIYGEDPLRCLVTRSKLSLIMSHIVQRASKPCLLTCYEYCLGLEFLSFHVDSRKNLIYLRSEWHTAFDAGKWILLPDTTTLMEVYYYVKSAIAWRRDPALDRVEDFTSKWQLESKTRYRLIPLPNLEPEPIPRSFDDKTWNFHYHPYCDLPELESHIAPPYVIINAGPKCIGIDLDKVAVDYHGSEALESQRQLKQQLELLRDTWALFQDAEDEAKAWEERARGAKRKRKCNDDDDNIDTSSQTTKRTTRSQYSGHGNQPSPSRRGSHPSGQHSAGSDKQPTPVSDTRKRKRGSCSNGATLTKTAVWHLCKRQKIANLNTMVERWVESTYS